MLLALMILERRRARRAIWKWSSPLRKPIVDGDLAQERLKNA